jgi:hypothetical protein
MAIISEWFSTLKQIFSSAGQFYEEETDTSIGGKPIRVAVVSLLLSGLLSAAYSVIMLPGEMKAMALLDILVTPIAGIVGIGLSAALTHLVGLLIGFKNGYSETFSAFAYATVISPVASLFAFVPLLGAFVGLVLGLFAVYVQIKGVQKFQNVSLGKAAVSVLVPVLIIIGILLVLSIVAGALFAAMMGAGGAPAAPPM